MTGSVYTRARRVLWRFADDRVVVRKVGDQTPGIDTELTGSTVVVWLTLDEPRTAPELRGALELAGVAEPADELELVLGMLHQHGLIAEQRS